MGQAEDLAFLRLCSCIVAGILYFTCFAIDSVNWVETDKFTWGLWKWRNPSDEMDGGFLTPTKQPGYYNAVRTLACFVLIGSVLYFFTLDLQKGLGAELKPLWLGLSNMTLLTIMLGLVGSFYKDDHRWKQWNPKLGWCYWVALASDCFIMISSLLFWGQYKIKTASVAPKKGPVKKRATPAPKKKTEQKPKTDTKPKLQAKDTKAQDKPTTSTTLPTPPPPPPPPKKTEPEPAENQDPKPPSPIVCTKPVLPAIVDGDAASLKEEEGAQGEPQDHKPRRPSASSSISVDLEPYHIPELPGLEPNQAGVPDYEKAAGRDDMKTPAVALPQNSVWNKTRKAMTFFANYAKAAVGRRSNDDASQKEGEA